MTTILHFWNIRPCYLCDIINLTKDINTNKTSKSCKLINTVPTLDVIMLYNIWKIFQSPNLTRRRPEWCSSEEIDNRALSVVLIPTMCFCSSFCSFYCIIQLENKNPDSSSIILYNQTIYLTMVPEIIWDLVVKARKKGQASLKSCTLVAHFLFN